MKKLNVLMLLLISLSACSMMSMSPIKNNDNDYLKAKTVSSLQTPAGVSAQSFGEDYPVPDNIASGNSAMPSQVPPGSLAVSKK